MTDLRWGRYVRVSSVEQAGPDSASIDHQLATTAELIAREGGALVDTYQDDKTYRDAAGRTAQPSGERADRPEWRRMLADLQSGRINAVTAFHEWRLYRDYRPFVDFIEVARAHHIPVRLVHGLWSEQFAVFGAWMGREDNRHRTLQTQKGVQAKGRRGFSMTNASPFYQVVRDDKGRRTGYVLRPDTLPWLRRLAELYLSGMSFNAMARELRTNPITGGPAQESSLKAILQNPFFRGRIEPGHYKGAADYSIVGVQPAAWDDATCAAIEAELARRAVVGRSTPHHGRYLFSGLLRCGVCGRLLTGARNYQRPNGQIRYACPLGARHKRPTPKDGEQTHPSNTVGERDVRLQLREVGRVYLAQKGEAATTAAAAQFIVPGTSLQGPSPERVEAKRGELRDLDREYETTPATNTRVRQWLEGEQARVANELAALEREAARVADPTVIASVVGADIVAFFESGILDAPDDELRPALLRQFPAIWFKDGKLCQPPETLWITPKRLR